MVCSCFKICRCFKGENIDEDEATNQVQEQSSSSATQRRFPLAEVERGCDIYDWVWTEDKLREYQRNFLDSDNALFRLFIEEGRPRARTKQSGRFAMFEDEWSMLKGMSIENEITAFLDNASNERELIRAFSLTHELLMRPQHDEAERVRQFRDQIRTRVDHLDNCNLRDVEGARKDLWKVLGRITDWKQVLFRVFCNEVRTLLLAVDDSAELEGGTDAFTLDDVYDMLRFRRLSNSQGAKNLAEETKIKKARDIGQAFVLVLDRIAEENSELIKSNRPLLDIVFVKSINQLVNKSATDFSLSDYVDNREVILEQLLTWLNRLREDKQTDPITAAAMAQLIIFCAQTFRGGNTRTGLLISAYILLGSGYPPIGVKTWKEYADRLSDFEKGAFCDARPFVRTFCSTLKATIEEMVEFAETPNRAVEEGTPSPIETTRANARPSPLQISPPQNLFDMVIEDDPKKLDDEDFGSDDQILLFPQIDKAASDPPTHDHRDESAAESAQKNDAEKSSQAKQQVVSSEKDADWERREREGVTKFLQFARSAMEGAFPEIVEEVRQWSREREKKRQFERERLVHAGRAWAQAMKDAIQEFTPELLTS